MCVAVVAVSLLRRKKVEVGPCREKGSGNVPFPPTTDVGLEKTLETANENHGFLKTQNRLFLPGCRPLRSQTNNKPRFAFVSAFFHGAMHRSGFQPRQK